MIRKRTRKRLLVTHVNRIRGSRFGKLVTRALEDGGLLGDVSILHEHLPPRTTLPEIHHRRTSEFVYCVSGSMSALLGGRKYRMAAGSVLLIPRGVRHQFSTGAVSCEAISIFSPALKIGPGADIHIG
ncbi:MAG: cupin domain-containing protein [Elusimicrobiota bacterium]|nr:cupin domain-containing protein [Elusimicrobiota bacterium]